MHKGSPTCANDIAIMISDDGFDRSIWKWYVNGATMFTVDVTVPFPTGIEDGITLRKFVVLYLSQGHRNDRS